MEKETMGTVISVIKQWWLKVNRKPARVHAMDGAAFPHIIKVKYTIDGKDYICRKWIGAGNINVNIKMYIFDHLRMYIFAILPLDRYIFSIDRIFP